MRSHKLFFSQTFLIVSIIVIVATLIGGACSYLGFINAFDTGIYLQIVSNLVRFGTWESSLTGELNFLSHHFQPIIALLIPFVFVWKSAAGLLFASSLSILGSCFVLVYLYENRIPSWVLALLTASFAIFPSIFMRMIHSFVPEVLALPAMLFLAHWIAQEPQESLRKYYFKAALLSLWIGLSKENMWIISAISFFLIGMRWKKIRRASFLFAALNSALFVGIFYVWMPQHTQMTVYYPYQYFQNLDITEPGTWGMLKSLWFNLLSLRSMETLLYSIIFATGGLVFFTSPWVLAGALPGVLLILISNHDPIHDMRNQYFISFLPFLWVGFCEAWLSTNVNQIQIRFRILRLGTIAILASSIANTAPTVIGLTFDLIGEYSRRHHIHDDVKKIRSFLDTEHDYLLVDGTLQPLFFDVKNSITILGFKGNPRHISSVDLEHATAVITLVPIEKIDSCEKISGNSKVDGGIEYDYEAFHAFCKWLKSAQKEKYIFDSGLIYYRIQKKAKQVYNVKRRPATQKIMFF